MIFTQVSGLIHLWQTLIIRIIIPPGVVLLYDNLNGFDETIDEAGFNRDIAYQYDTDGDDGWAQSYIGISVLGDPSQ